MDVSDSPQIFFPFQIVVPYLLDFRLLLFISQNAAIEFFTLLAEILDACKKNGDERKTYFMWKLMS